MHPPLAEDVGGYVGANALMGGHGLQMLGDVLGDPQVRLQVGQLGPGIGLQIRTGGAADRLVDEAHAHAVVVDHVVDEGAIHLDPLLTLQMAGLSPQEDAQARAAGFVPVTLGPRVLRAETAALTVLVQALA